MINYDDDVFLQSSVLENIKNRSRRRDLFLFDLKKYIIQHSSVVASGVTSVNGDSGPVVTLNAADIPYIPSGSLTATDVQAAIDELVNATDPLVTTTDWQASNPVVIKTFSDTVSAAIVEFSPEVGFISVKKRKLLSSETGAGGTIALSEALSGARIEHDEAADRVMTLPQISSMGRDFTFFEIYVTSASNYLEIRSGSASDTFETGSNYVSETVTSASGYNWFRINTPNTGYILSADPTGEWRVVQKLGATSSGGSTNYLGFYTTEAALTTAHPTANQGDYAFVDDTPGGVFRPKQYVWDGASWVDSSGIVALSSLGSSWEVHALTHNSGSEMYPSVISGLSSLLAKSEVITRTNASTILTAENSGSINLLDASSNNVTITLPQASLVPDGVYYTVKAVDVSNTITVQCNDIDDFESGRIDETITTGGGFDSFELATLNKAYTFVSEDTEWKVFKQYDESASGSGYTTGTDATTVLKFSNNYTKHVGASEAALSGAISIFLDASAQIGNTAVLKYNDTTAPNLSSTNFTQINSLADNFKAGQDMWMLFTIVETITPTILVSFQSSPNPSTHKVLTLRPTDFAVDPTAPASVGVFTVNDRSISTLQFDATTNTDFAHVGFVIPDDYVTGSTLLARVEWSATGSGTSTFVIRGASGPDSVDVFNTAYGSDNVQADDLALANGFQRSQPIELDINGQLGAGHYVMLELEIDATATSDTLTTVHVKSVTVQYEASTASVARWDTTVDNSPPTAPTLTASNPTANTIDLSWTASTDNIAVVGYQIQRSLTTSTGFATIATVSNILTYQDTGLTGGTQYFYRVRALDAVGNPSSWSAEANETTTGGSFSGVLSGITHTERAYWSMLKQRYTGITNAFQIRRNSDSATYDVPFDSNGRPDNAGVAAFLGTALVNGANPATVVKVYDQSGVHEDLKWGWTQGSATSTEPTLMWDTTKLIFGANITGGSGLTGPMGRAGFTGNITIPQPAIWFDVFNINSLASVGRWRDHYILNLAEAHELVLHSAVNPYIFAGGSTINISTPVTGTETLWTSTYDGASSGIRVDGVADVTGNAGTQTMGNVLVGVNSTLNANHADAIFYEMGCIDATGISAGDITTIETEIIADASI